MIQFNKEELRGLMPDIVTSYFAEEDTIHG